MNHENAGARKHEDSDSRTTGQRDFLFWDDPFP